MAATASPHKSTCPLVLGEDVGFRPAFAPRFYETADGLSESQNPAPGVLYTRAVGIATPTHIARLKEVFDLVAACHHPVESFHDWSHCRSRSLTEAREILTEWSLSHRQFVERAHILVSSPITQMGLHVANLAVGGYLIAYSRRQSFERALVHAVEERLRRLQGAGGPLQP